MNATRFAYTEPISRNSLLHVDILSDDLKTLIWPPTAFSRIKELLC